MHIRIFWLYSLFFEQKCHVKNKDIRKFLDGIYVSEKGTILEEEWLIFNFMSYGSIMFFLPPLCFVFVEFFVLENFGFLSYKSLMVFLQYVMDIITLPYLYWNLPSRSYECYINTSTIEDICNHGMQADGLIRNLFQGF